MKTKLTLILALVAFVFTSIFTFSRNAEAQTHRGSNPPEANQLVTISGYQVIQGLPEGGAWHNWMFAIGDLQNTELNGMTEFPLQSVGSGFHHTTNYPAVTPNAVGTGRFLSNVKFVITDIQIEFLENEDFQNRPYIVNLVTGRFVATGQQIQNLSILYSTMSRTTVDWHSSTGIRANELLQGQSTGIMGFMILASEGGLYPDQNNPIRFRYHINGYVER